MKKLCYRHFLDHKSRFLSVVFNYKKLLDNPDSNSKKSFEVKRLCTSTYKMIIIATCQTYIY